MKANISLSNDGMLAIGLYGVEDSEKGRGKVARISYDLLKAYGRDKGEVVVKEDDGTLTYCFYRERTDKAMYDAAINVLKSYNL